MIKLQTVVMAGGTGSRLWPMSRAMYPKQFISLTSQYSMLQNTVNRVESIESSSLQVICNDEHRFFVAEQLQELNQKVDIILEPVGRNTAPAIALAALNATKNSEDSLLLVLAADHVIEDQTAFEKAVNVAIPLAKQGKLVTFGIVPSEPHTGYGYIKQGEDIDQGFLVDEFVEKPDSEKAQQYLKNGGYLWNSGMFLFSAKRYLQELAAFSEEILAACEAAFAKSNVDLDFIRIDAEAFALCPDDSIDYAVMEKTEDAVVVPMDAGWSDVGSWSSLWDIAEKDTAGNVANGDVMLHDASNNYIRAEGRLVAAIGIDDLVVIDTKDALMVASKDHVQDVKKIVQRLKVEKRSEFEFHREVYRPWGKYDSIDNGERYQVKRITVKPGAKLSVQMHHHRAEHWIVVSGTANVTKDSETFMLSENQSTYIPIGVVHALENPGKVPLELIEVQSGSYLGEDDIVRFEDIYGRVKK